ncbi:hypothetical protein GCM10023335_31340 [Streptomyces siamensis]|uniref:Uncharacterized protein n=1 Tax=Streptomyces siamensis TaxID=1274986 RepID=A0ABP9IUW3_9ACTN
MVAGRLIRRPDNPQIMTADRGNGPGRHSGRAPRRTPAVAPDALGDTNCRRSIRAGMTRPTPGRRSARAAVTRLRPDAQSSRLR